MIRPDPDQGTATKLIITDIIYGLAALTLLGSASCACCICQGSEFYTQNPLFGGRLAHLGAGALSLYPTITYILWAIPLRKGEAPSVSAGVASRIAG